MLNVFAIAGTVLHRDPHLGLDAVYTPSNGAACAVRVVPNFTPEVDGLLGTGTRRATLRVDLLVHTVPARPADGETLRIGTTTYRIRSATTDDEAGTVWVLDLDPT